ncbi:MAG TPA: sugar phosphate isomerase/epimerase family protein [Opitutaceae bacterium]|jgi:D-psicose/D-tagatose/L-ribulose 3-epimerase|nr:sugar phosphate isomerase/epimerase family protein [Opitutaceae bacterium]
MNKIGIYYAYWTHNWDADFVPYIAKVKRLGFDILEVNAGTVARMSTAQRTRLKTAAEKARVELTYCIGLPKEYDIAAADPKVRRDGIAFLRQIAEAMQFMGHKQLGGIIYSSWPGKLPFKEDKRRYLDRSVRSMKEVMKSAEDCGVYFNVEVVNRFEQYLMNTAAEAVSYVDRVESDNCRILLDTFHLNIEEESIGGAIEAAGAKLGHFHIGETNRKPPGRGRMPWDEIFGALRKIKYQGALTMEPFLMTGGEVGRDISVYRDLREGRDLDDEARRAVRFVRKSLRALA